MFILKNANWIKKKSLDKEKVRTRDRLTAWLRKI